MQRLVLPLAAVAWLAACNGAPAEGSLEAALSAARTDADIPFNLQVNCTEQESRRSLTVIRGHVAVWGNERQVSLSTKDRGALIDMLLDANFADFAARYGETSKADKQEAPLRVICRIHVAVQAVEKTSVQVLDGEQSEQLLGLARRLLDHVEPLAARGVAAADLDDGLAKLDSGTLAGDVLGVRILTLPADGSAESGTILRIENGQISKQDYAPGEAIGPIHTEALSECQLREIVAALRSARPWELPVNLYADAVTELEVSVLSQQKSVYARPTFSPAPAKQQTAFADLITRLTGQPADCGESRP